MRLTDEERRIIREAVAEVYGPTAVVRLFGSRVHDHLRGGDIDLHVEADAAHAQPEAGFAGLKRYKHNTLRWRLQELLGEQRFDVVETVRGRELSGIERVAYEQGERV